MNLSGCGGHVSLVELKVLDGIQIHPQKHKYHVKTLLSGVRSCRSSTGYAALQFQTGVSKAHAYAEKEGQF